MAKEYVSGVHIVRVVMKNDPNRSTHLWIAAVSRDDAVQAVRDAVPDALIVELTNQLVTKELAALHKLRPGYVSEVSSI